jgi:hypothetical protein
VQLLLLGKLCEDVLERRCPCGASFPRSSTLRRLEILAGKLVSIKLVRARAVCPQIALFPTETCRIDVVHMA